MRTRTFTRRELEDLGVPYEDVIYTEQLYAKRWATVHHAVFRVEPDGPMWRVRYYEPVTGAKDCDLWGYGHEPEFITAIEVEPYAVEVTCYRPVEVGADVRV